MIELLLPRHFHLAAYQKKPDPKPPWPILLLKFSSPMNLCSGYFSFRNWNASSSKQIERPKNPCLQINAIKDTDTSSVQTVSACPRRNLICSGSWDCSIKIWQIVGEMDIESNAGSVKKRKLEDST